MGLVQPDVLLRFGQSRAKLVDLLAQIVLSLAGRFQFLFHGLAFFGVQIGRLDVLLHRVDSVAADALLQGVGQAGVDDLGQAAQLLLDALGLAHQRGEDAVFRPLLVDEVVAEYFVGFGWSLRSMRPLRCSMRLGFHGTSKWNKFQQWA